MQLPLLEEDYAKYEKEDKEYHYPDAPNQCPICKERYSVIPLLYTSMIFSSSIIYTTNQDFA